MKKLFISLALIGACIVSQTAAADSRHNRHGYSYYPGNSFSFNHRRHNGYDYYRSRANSYHYGRGNRRGNNFSVSFGSRGYYPAYSRHYYGNRFYGNRFYGNRYRYDSSDVGSFVGGVVLGSLLNSASSNHSDYRRSYYPNPVKEVVYVNEARGSTQTYSTNKPRLSGRKLIKDREGNCFERVINDQGDEVRLEIDAQECSY